TINSLVDTLSGSTDAQRSANLAQAQIDMEAFFTNVLEVRTSIGGRLNGLEAQFDDNIAFSIATQTTISTLRDTDLAEAISQLTLEQTTLDAAQAVFAKITSSSLFNYLR
ncbi:MAG: flagellar hook-associated protein FlgL, partial [Gammaproteobacteria bacterium]|nr:flagellar hook-associated protein FlgL [Gammaproteobacteria bacterium]